MRIQISHQSTYHYDREVEFGLQQVRLTPQTRNGQTVRQWSINLDGATKQVAFSDHHMNHVELISFDEGQKAIDITSSGVVETDDSAGIVAPVQEASPTWLYQRTTRLTQPGREVQRLIAELSDRSGSSVDQLHNLSQLVADAVEYRPGDTHSASTSEEALAIGSGVCQDHTHIFSTAARLLGYPARYVSGYLYMDDRTTQDASHAWAEVFVSDLGWVGFDVSNRICPDERYVKIATGLDYSEAAPISGIRFGEGSEELKVTLQVQQ